MRRERIRRTIAFHPGSRGMAPSGTLGVTRDFPRLGIGCSIWEMRSNTVTRFLLRSFFLFLGFALFCHQSVIAGSGSARPNVVFLLTDDQTTYSLQCYGNPDVKTRHIDQLASEGLVFDNHYNTTAICMASRANIMTGMFEYKTGCNFEHGPLLKTHWEKSYPVLLRKAGYATAFAGKFGFEVADKPWAKGILPEGDFDRWGGGPGQTHFETIKNKSMASYAKKYPHSSRAYGAFGRDFIQDCAKQNKPFCLSISFKAPHRPVSPDPVDDAVYQGKTFLRPDNYGREYGEHFSRQSRQGRQYERFKSWDYDKDYDGVMAKYHQQIYAVDAAVGMIREALKKHGVEENTVVIFTSDNGFFCGSHGYGSKVLPYEESSRAPLIVFDPRVQGKERAKKREPRTAALTGNVDFAPTILDLAGLPIPANMDGKSLVPVLNNPTVAEIHRTLPLINVWGPRECHSLAVVTKDYKYIYWNYAEGDYEPVEELYHTAEDPLELTNVAAAPEQAKQLKDMRAEYESFVATWKKSGVPYHRYQQFGTVFDRTATWEEKKKAMASDRRPARPKK